MTALRRVQRAAERRITAEQEFRKAIRAAVSEGNSVRTVAKAAGVTHPRVVAICKHESHRSPQ